MVATFNGNPSTAIIFCYSPTNASDETDLITKHNVLIIGEGINAQIGKNENKKFSLHNSPKRYGEHLRDFSLENGLTCLNTKFQKRKGKLWIYTYANNAEAHTTNGPGDLVSIPGYVIPRL